MTEIRIELGLPPDALMPNRAVRMHHMAKHRARKAYRNEAKMCSLVALERRPWPMWETATATACFYFNTNRRRDKDNLAASLKAAWDGICDAGILENDSGLTVESVEIAVDKSCRPRVEIVVRQT